MGARKTFWAPGTSAFSPTESSDKKLAVDGDGYTQCGARWALCRRGETRADSRRGAWPSRRRIRKHTSRRMRRPVSLASRDGTRRRARFLLWRRRAMQPGGVSAIDTSSATLRSSRSSKMIGRTSLICRAGLEEVTDRKFEEVRVVDGPAGQGEADLEPERSEGREPPQPEAHALEEAQGQCASTLRALEEVFLLREDVTGVEEAHAAEARGPDQGELHLPVRDQLLVAAHREVDDGGVGLADVGDLEGRRDAAQAVAADRVDSALEELLADGHRVIHGVGGPDVPHRDVRLEDQAPEERPVEPLDEAI